LTNTTEVDMPTRFDRDEELLEALRQREPTAAEDLVASYGGRAYRLAIAITGNQPDAEEVVQDALWAVVRKIDTFTGDSTFGSWFYRIVANAAYDKLRGRRRRLDDCSLDELSAMVDAHGESVLDWSSRVKDPALETDLRIVLTAAIEALPEEYRTVVVLRDVEGLSMQEIAQITALSVANVKVRTHRARLVLRKRLGAYLSGPLPPAARAPVTRTDRYRTDAVPPTAMRAAGVVTGTRGATS
jgi:RNA polymerase sigma-70 factor (ECF subfamily)